MALFLVASCLGISSSMKGELGIRIKFFSFLLYFFLYHFCMINSQICKWRMTVYPYICALDIMEIQLILML